MRWWVQTVFLAVLMAFVTPSEARAAELVAAARAALSAPVAVERLDNGLVVLVRRDATAPLVAVQVRYGVGAADDPPGARGTAHLLEHLMSVGSEHAPAGAYDRWLGEAGGDNNAWTDHDATAYHLVVPPGALDLALFLESDRMAHLAGGIGAGDVDLQRAVVDNERAQAWAVHGGMDFAAISAALYPPGHPYHHPVMGWPGDLGGATLDEVLAFHARWYDPGNAVVAVVGDVEVDLALERVRHWFGDIPGRPRPDRAAWEQLPAAGERRVVFVDERTERKLYAVWPTVPRGHPDEAALDLLAEILGAGRGSRLDGALARGLGPPANAAAWTHNGRLGGLFVVELSSGRRSPRWLLRRLEQALRRLDRDPPGAAELRRRQDRWQAWMIRSDQDVEDQAAHLAECAWLAMEPTCASWDLDRHLAVTPGDLARVARTWLGPERRLLVSAVPPLRRSGLPKGSVPLVLPR